MSGSHLVAEDVDRLPGVTDGVTVTWNQINLRGSRCITFSGLFAEADGTGSGSIDPSDFILVEYRLGGAGNWTPLLRFEGLPQQFNTFFYLSGNETDRLGGEAKEYSATIDNARGAAYLDLRLQIMVTSQDEDAGVDSFMLTPCDVTPGLRKGPNGTLTIFAKHIIASHNLTHTTSSVPVDHPQVTSSLGTRDLSFRASNITVTATTITIDASACKPAITRVSMIDRETMLLCSGGDSILFISDG